MIAILKATSPQSVELYWQKGRQSGGLNAANSLPKQEEHVLISFRTALTRPFRFVFCVRSIPILTLYTTFINSYTLIILSTLGTTFEAVYSFSLDASGLAYLGMTAGFLLSEIVIGLCSDACVSRKARQRSGSIEKPE